MPTASLAKRGKYAAAAATNPIQGPYCRSAPFHVMHFRLVQLAIMRYRMAQQIRLYLPTPQFQRQTLHERGLRHFAAAAADHRGRRHQQSLSGSPHLVQHIREMGQYERAPPFFFAKPADAIVPDGGTVPYPSLTKDMHHEVELVVALKSGGRNIPVGKANYCIYGYAVGIDLTRRDLQFASREIKRPWEVGKAFDHSAPCGPLKPAAESGHPSKGKITLKVNGKVRQR